MKTKILEALKNKYSNLGFNKEVLESVATQMSSFVTEESQIATAVEGAEPMLKTFQSFADSRVSTYKTEADKAKARVAELEKAKGGNPNPNPAPSNDDVPDYVKQMQDTMTKMQETLQGFQTQQVSQTLKESFIAKMKEKEVPEEYYAASLAGREFENAEKVDELANIVSQNYDAFKQKSTDLGFSFTKPPEDGGSPEKESEALANQIRKGTEEIVKQKQN